MIYSLGTHRKTNLFIIVVIRWHYLFMVEKKRMSKSLVVLYSYYCCTRWGNCNNTFKHSLLKLQKRAARIILDQTDIQKSSHVLFSESGITKIDKRICYHKSLLVYKYFNKSTPSYFDNLLTPLEKTSVYNTRLHQKKSLQIPKHKTELFKSSFSYSGAKIWNSLPSEIQNANSIYEFKRLFKQNI